MQDVVKNLTPQQMARLVKYLDGGDDTPDGAVLHAEKNAPWVNGMYSSYRAPAYVHQPYPKWLFNAQWLRADEQWRNALTLRGRRGREQDETERIIADATAARDACMRLVQNADEERLLGSTWCETPQKAVEAQEAHDRAIAAAAAESNWDDRLMSPAAKAERDAADAASDGHLVEVPRTPVKRSHNKKRGRGRPRKVGVPVVEPVEVTP
jgi:hypothetical protein